MRYTPFISPPFDPSLELSTYQAPNLCTRLWLESDIVPVVFNIKPFHTESVTRPNLKHRISASGSYLPSGAETPNLLLVDKPSDTGNLQSGVTQKVPLQRTIDEQADSAARKCLMYYGPGNNPRLNIAARNQVAVDAGGKIHLIDDLEEYRKTVGESTWNCVIKMADELRDKKVKIGFFSSTPQGGTSIFPGVLSRMLSADRSPLIRSIGGVALVSFFS